MERLSLEQWKVILNNLQNMSEEEYYDGEVSWIEVLWLDGSDEWCLCFGEEMFEDGFKTEKEAQDRLNYLEQTILK